MNEETQNKNEGRRRKPTFKGDGVAVWVNIARDGSEYLSIRIVGHTPIYAFFNKE
jgi:hypothetical protein